MYQMYFNAMCYLGPLALPSLVFWKRSGAKFFMLAYALIAMYFSRKMVRLVLLLSPAASVLGGITMAGIFDWALSQSWLLVEMVIPPAELEEFKAAVAAPSATTTTTVPTAATATDNKEGGKKKDKKDGKKDDKKGSSSFVSSSLTFEGVFNQITAPLVAFYNKMQTLRVVGAIFGLYFLWVNMRSFQSHSHQMAEMLSNPSIILRATTQGGQHVNLDDFRLAYWWIRDNTPQDARIMSWWDYGYQISQIANRTTLADGNTWNHEHIALLGKCLVSSVPESHKIVRHLADYVLVWSTRFVGNQADDVAKSPHMARIGGSVFKDINPQAFYIDQSGRPSKMMYESLVFQLVMNKFDQSVPALPSDHYVEAYTSPNRMVRVYKVLRVDKESKAYGAENRGYQAWLAGTHLSEAYPPKLQSIISKREDFEQLEDFNAKKNKKKKASEEK